MAAELDVNQFDSLEVYRDGPELRDPASWLPLAAGVTSRNLGSIFLQVGMGGYESREEFGKVGLSEH